LAKSALINAPTVPAAAGGCWQGPLDVHVDVCEESGWDGDGLHRRRVLPGCLGPLALLAVFAPGSLVTVETAPDDHGGD